MKPHKSLNEYFLPNAEKKMIQQEQQSYFKLCQKSEFKSTRKKLKIKVELQHLIKKIIEPNNNKK